MDDITAAAVRIDRDGLVSLKPYVDFRQPGHECPPAPAVARRPVQRIEAPAPGLPDFLMRRAPPLAWLAPGGNA